MAKYTDPKCKLCRRAAEKLMLKGERCNSTKCAMVKRNYPPGFHGPKGKKRLTDYGLQLNEKQKAKRQYNMLEKQFRLTFDKALSQTGNTGDIFLQYLEMRLDSVIYNIGFASSRAEARQMINHGHFEVNNVKTNIPSFATKTGDIITITKTKANAKPFRGIAEKLAKKDIPGWINLDVKKVAAKVLHKPDIKTLKPNFNIQMVIEYYSK